MVRYWFVQTIHCGMSVPPKQLAWSWRPRTVSTGVSFTIKWNTVLISSLPLSCQFAQGPNRLVIQLSRLYISLYLFSFSSLILPAFSFCKLFSFYLCFSLFLSVSVSCPFLSFLFRKFWSNVCNVSCGVGLHLKEFHYKLESSWVAVDEVHAKQMASSGNDTDAGRRGTL